MFSKFLGVLKQGRQIYRDSSLNRKLVGYDRFGNQYYEYYNDKGMATSRECLYKDDQKMQNDPVWSDWLNKRQMNAFSPEELDKIYEKEYEMMKQGRKVDQYTEQSQSTYSKTKDYQKKQSTQFSPEEWYQQQQNQKK